MYNYILETIKEIKTENSIFFKHKIPKLFKKENNELHRGLNQLKLSQQNFSEYTVSSIELINQNIMFKADKPVLICEKCLNNQSIRYYFYFKNEFKPEQIIKYRARKKEFYNLSDINDIIEYYFCCSLNEEPYIPRFNNNQKNDFLNFIDKKPYEFSLKVNEIFKRIVRGSKYEYLETN